MNLSKFRRRESSEVHIAGIVIGGKYPIAVQSMTNCDTNDIVACEAQIERIVKAGAPIVRLTVQGKREAQSITQIADTVRAKGLHCAIVADVHYRADVAQMVAKSVDKVRINPGNYSTNLELFDELIEMCRTHNTALRIGVNHGSLAQRVVDEWGDTPQGMVHSAMEFMLRARQRNFDQVVVSMKSSNTRVMVVAYRLLVEAMEREGLHYPIHLGVTEAGNGLYGRIKSAVGIGALLADGIGDTIRVSLTEAPENEVPVAKTIIDNFASREGEFSINHPERYNATHFTRRTTIKEPIIHTEPMDGFVVIEARSTNPTAELRAAALNTDPSQPIVVKCRYTDSDPEVVAIKAAADLGSLFLDGLADGIWIDAPALKSEQRAEIELLILQAARARITQTEYIACPSCGRTLFDIEARLEEIKQRTSHLRGLKIAVMGCIVNGVGEMADADYGYVGAGRGRVSLYKKRELIHRNIPQEDALDRLIELIKENSDFREQ